MASRLWNVEHMCMTTALASLQVATWLSPTYVDLVHCAVNRQLLEHCSKYFYQICMKMKVKQNLELMTAP
jgi:hypothetical protein